jgi:adenylate cyclase
VSAPDRPNDAIWIEAGLLDPSAPHADERRELLAFLTEQGLTLATMVEACEQQQLVTVAGDRLLRPGHMFTVDELARRAGMDDLEFVTELRTASGFPPSPPDEPACTDDDVEMFRLFELASEVFSRQELLHFVRALGVSMRRIAEAAAEMFLRDVEATQHVERATELERALTNIQAIELGSAATAVFAPMFRAHLVLAIGDARRARRHHHDYETTPFTVGFVDLTGFTARAGASSPAELLRLVTWFEATAHDLVTSHGGRLVKLIGDEVMFATVEPDQGCSIALALTRIADMPARGGLAHGQVVTSGGDLSGPVVNLASRIADVAIPGEVLVDQAVVDAVRTDPHVTIEIDVEPAGRRQLKGFAEPVRLWSISER